MKNALLVTCENTVNAYTHLEIAKALVKRGYNIRKFNATSAELEERESVLLEKPEIAILSNPFTPRKTFAYSQNIPFLKELTCTTFVNDVVPHLETCNKWVTFNRVLNSDIPFVKTVLTDFSAAPKNHLGSVFYSDADLDILDEHIEYLGGFPLVYKSIFGAVGKFVFLVRSKEHLRETLINNKEDYPSFILQEYIKSAEATMLCVRVVGDEVFTRIYLGSPLEKVSFKSVIAEGKIHIAGHASDEVRDIALKSARLMNLDTSRIEMFITNDGIKLCEINSLGSLISTDQVNNICLGELLVDHAIKKSKNRIEEVDVTDNDN